MVIELAGVINPSVTLARCFFSNVFLEPVSLVHPKLCNINLHNVTRSLIPQNPRERMFVVQISLLIVTSLSLISRNLL